MAVRHSDTGQDRCLELSSLQHRAERSTSPGSSHGGLVNLPTHCQVPSLFLFLVDSVTSMLNLFPETYLPPGNYKAILAQQASTHKGSPPGLLQITCSLLKLVSTCLAKAQLREVIFMEYDLRDFESPLILGPTLEATSGTRILGLFPAGHPQSQELPLLIIQQCTLSLLSRRVHGKHCKRHVKPPTHNPPTERFAFGCFSCMPSHCLMSAWQMFHRPQISKFFT